MGIKKASLMEACELDAGGLITPTQRALYFRITRSCIRRLPGECSLKVVQLKGSQLSDRQTKQLSTAE